MRIILLCVLSILGGRSAAMEETASSLSGGSASSSLPSSGSSSLHGPRFSSFVDPRDQILGGKRAYTYRSEFKRLPVYQFGLGKRWAQGIEGKVRFLYYIASLFIHAPVQYVLSYTHA
jgi:hypothetical protein